MTKKIPLCSQNFCIYLQCGCLAVQEQSSDSEPGTRRLFSWVGAQINFWDCIFLVGRRVYFCLLCNCLMAMKMFMYHCLFVWTYTRKSLILDSLLFPKIKQRKNKPKEKKVTGTDDQIALREFAKRWEVSGCMADCVNL